MSALAAWDLVPAPAPVRPPARPALRLVPGGAPAGNDAGAAPRRVARGLRLTRAGRLAVFALVVAVVVLIAPLRSAGSAASAPHREVTVQAGQTLSQIAVATLPQLTVAEGVAQLQLANGLSTPHIHAGQRLVVPHVG